MRRWGCGGVFDLELVDERPGYICFRATGKDATHTFRHEAGGHRWQGVPRTEKNGRVHTSTVTIAVLREPTQAEVRIDDRDLEWSACRGSGAGGQHRNTTDSAVIVKHKPSGLTVRCEAERSQLQNKATALSLLRTRLFSKEQASITSSRNADRKSQLGCGARGDKRRTTAEQRDSVVDHVTGKRTTIDRYKKGWIEDLW